MRIIKKTVSLLLAAILVVTVMTVGIVPGWAMSKTVTWVLGSWEK